MKEEKQRDRVADRKVVPLRRDAGFFFEKAVSSLDRYQYDKALKYFRKAVEYEPDNPVNHCNMAGILSEMGNYEASNEVLLSVLKDVDPNMTECYFYLANNYANMEQFEAAEEALITYLEEDPSGQFLSEAEEMMDLLHYELNRPAKVKYIKSREGMAEHDEARAMLEEGKFSGAVKLLESIVEEHPDFLAARNNLALGYYYLGMFPQAMEAIHGVLEREPGNLHGLCNLAVFIQHDGDQASLQELAQRLRSIVPFHQEHVFKLATTMGILGEHEAAFGHFSRLLHDEEVNYDPCLFHYTAVAAYNTGRYSDAKRLWRHAAKLDPGSEIPVFYLDRLERLQEHGREVKISYHYHLPFEEQLKLWDKWGESIPDAIKEDPLIRSSFFWALRHGDAQTKLQVIQAFSLIADAEVKEALQAFLLEPGEEKYLKDLAVFVLRTLGVTDPLPICLDGKTQEVAPGFVSARLPVWEPQWQAVLDEARRRMAKRYSVLQQHDAETIWVEFITRSYPEAPSTAHVGGWAAAVEYLTAKMHRRPVTYEEVAKRYGVSVSTASRCTRRVDEVCGIKEKMNAMFPSG
ncbi:DDE transposase family protein [Paenibacillus sp. CAA11]|uniref:tetratricopeptide repeat protein n=1 Tax=Paenibacillus sp. CAA11 TaxID=1532905 RepID=UPI000D368B70|nr:tetratricopeptide repeat protein [Paenibacillus sp. CAA11]AWB42914.1 DDE transposase family protein [Paenibacillus sp. CAA11]